MTKPARVASNGRDARVGSSSSATSPRIAQKPARITGCMHASVPPASTTSASPRRIISAPSPTACEPGRARRHGRVVRAAQPEVDRDLPARRVDEDVREEPRRHAIVAALAEDVVLLEDADDAADRGPDEDPGARRIDALDAGVRPRLARGGDRENDVPLEPARVLRPDDASGSNPFTSEAMRTGKSLASNERIQSTPLVPATAASQVDRASSPSGVTAPRPVTATRRMSRRA